MRFLLHLSLYSLSISLNKGQLFMSSSLNSLDAFQSLTKVLLNLNHLAIFLISSIDKFGLDSLASIKNDFACFKFIVNILKPALLSLYEE